MELQSLLWQLLHRAEGSPSGKGKIMLSKPKKLLIILITLSILLAPALASARVGVGVNIGKIQIDQELKPGGIYKLPPVTVINTGDEKADYAVEATYHAEQKELRPEQRWFSFYPKEFTLEPGKSQKVNISLHLPILTKPGDYFAYIEGHPIRKEGQVTIGIAAASKLYFKVVPSTWWQALYHKIITFFTANAPTSYIVLGILVLLVIISIVNKYYGLKIAVKIKKKK